MRAGASSTLAARAAGDVVRIEIEGIGWIENAMIDEPESTRTR